VLASSSTLAKQRLVCGALAPGVILMDGDHPAKVPDCIIDDIRGESFSR
jgi:hypothetical protein